MPHWIRLITLTDEGISRMRKSPSQILVSSRQIIDDLKGRLLTAFVTLGEFDVLSIIEARDVDHMEAIDAALERTGIYTARNISAVPANEFLMTVAKTPIFLDSWLSGRAQARAALDLDSGSTTGPQMPAASSTTGTRKDGLNERTSLRLEVPDGQAHVVFSSETPQIRAPLVNMSFGAKMTDRSGMCFRVTVDEGLKLGAPAWTPGTVVPVTMEIDGEKDTIPFDGVLVRVDLIGTEFYEIGVQCTDLTRPQMMRMQRYHQRVKRSQK